jgi:hypothetical protein
MKHTPGPWKVDWYDNNLHAEITNELEVGKGYRHITNALPLHDGGPHNIDGISLQAIADANLMAASPDLLKACKTMRDLWGRNLTEAMTLVNAAIAKAEGREP